jgi:hypothetical protein
VEVAYHLWVDLVVVAHHSFHCQEEVANHSFHYPEVEASFVAVVVVVLEEAGLRILPR